MTMEWSGGIADYLDQLDETATQTDYEWAFALYRSTGRLGHEDGIPWHDAPRPRRLHSHINQTIRFGGLGGVTTYCPCGASSAAFTPWSGRNSRWDHWWQGWFRGDRKVAA